MPDINIGAITEALNDKEDRDLRNTDTGSGADAVIEFQNPTAENDYTWYRKYASGWVEQGGCHDHGSVANNFEDTINLPIEMQDTNYTAFVIVNTSTQGQVGIEVSEKNTVSIKIKAYPNYGNSYTQRYSSWEVKGISAN